MLNVSAKALQGLAALLLERAGLKITPDGYHSLRLALSTRMPALGIDDPEAYVQKLKEPGGEHELRSLLPLVTVGHTEFFRDAKQFRALEKRVLPDLVATARREMRKLGIWSAGCATGEEPYSVSMVLAELGALAVEVDLWATDLNLAAVEAARLGRFSLRRMAGMGPARLHRFFKPVEEGYEVLPVLKEYVRFDGQNLAVPVFDKVANNSLDLILCRNVIIYFDLPTIRGLMDRFLAALRPGGLLFLGYSESLFKVYDRFEMIEVEGAFIYRRPLTPRALRAPLAASEAAAPPAPALPAAPTRPVAERLSGTFAAIGSTRPAAERKTVELPALPIQRAFPPLPPPGWGVTGVGAEPPRRVVEMPAPVRPPEPPRVRITQELPAWQPVVPPAERLALAVKKMEAGDFQSAIAGVQRLLADEPSDLDALLTLGNLYSLMGRIVDAREAFSQALNREPLCVEARVFGGVAALQAGDLPDARSELGKALFLEPTLAIGHYLLAQVQERSKDFEGARRSYRNAIAQLRFPQRELAGHYPDLPDSADGISSAARYALAALEERQ
ncbi:CheR family methyltransferase [Myxococcaceae bacterium GXIMD 01537]